MYYKEPNHIMQKVHYESVDIAKYENEKIGRKIQVYANKVVDDYVINEGKGYTNQQIIDDLTSINKPKVDKEYKKIIDDKKTSNNIYYQIEVKKKANAETVQITQEQYNQIYENINSIQKVLDKWAVNIDNYKEKVNNVEDIVSRKNIVNQNIITSHSSHGYYYDKNGKKVITGHSHNIKPHVLGYRELGPIAEIQHRKVQNKASHELALAQNEEAKANNEPLPNTYKTWVWTGRGKTTRHMSNDGQTVPIDEKFTIVNDKDGHIDLMDYPLDPEVHSSNTGLCYCKVEYHNEEESKPNISLTKDKVKHLDNLIQGMQETYNDNVKIKPVNLDKQSILHEVITKGKDIPEAHYELAAELIYEYAHATGLEEIPLFPTYKVLIEHFRNIKLNECKQLLKNFYTKTQDLEHCVALAQAQADLLEIVDPLADIESFSEKPIIDDIGPEQEGNINKLKEEMEIAETKLLSSDSMFKLVENAKLINENFFIYVDILEPVNYIDCLEMINYGYQLLNYIDIKALIELNIVSPTIKKQLLEQKDGINETIKELINKYYSFEPTTIPQNFKEFLEPSFNNLKNTEDKFHFKEDSYAVALLFDEYVDNHNFTSEKEFQDVIKFGEDLEKEIQTLMDKFEVNVNDFSVGIQIIGNKSTIYSATNKLKEKSKEFKKQKKETNSKNDVETISNKSEKVKQFEEKLWQKLNEIKDLDSTQTTTNILEFYDMVEKLNEWYYMQTAIISDNAEYINYKHLSELALDIEDVITAKYKEYGFEEPPNQIKSTLKEINETSKKLKEKYDFFNEQSGIPKKSQNVEFFEGYMEDSFKQLENANTYEELASAVSDVISTYKSEVNLFGHGNKFDYYYIVKYGEKIKETIEKKHNEIEGLTDSLIGSNNSLIKDNLEPVIEEAKKDHKTYSGEDYETPTTSSAETKPVGESENVKNFKKELESNIDFLKKNGGKGIGALKIAMSGTIKKVEQEIKNPLKEYVIEDIPYIEEQINEILEIIDSHNESLKISSNPNVMENQGEIIKSKNQLKKAVNDLKKTLDPTNENIVKEDVSKSDKILTFEYKLQQDYQELIDSKSSEVNAIVINGNADTLAKKYEKEVLLFEQGNKYDYHYLISYGEKIILTMKTKKLMELQSSISKNVMQKHIDKVQTVIDNLKKDYETYTGIAYNNEEINKVIEENLQNLEKQENGEKNKQDQEKEFEIKLTIEEKIQLDFENEVKKKEKELDKWKQKQAQFKSELKNTQEELNFYDEQLEFDEVIDDDWLREYNKTLETEVIPLLKETANDIGVTNEKSFKGIQKAVENIQAHIKKKAPKDSVQKFSANKLSEEVLSIAPITKEITWKDTIVEHGYLGSNDIKEISPELLKDLNDNKIIESLNDLSNYNNAQEHQQEYQKLLYTLKNIELFFEKANTNNLPLNDFKIMKKIQEEIKKYEKVYDKDDFFDEDFSITAEEYKTALDNSIEYIINKSLDIETPYSTIGHIVSEIEMTEGDLKYLDDNGGFSSNEEEVKTHMETLGKDVEDFILLYENSPQYFDNDDLFAIKKLQHSLEEWADINFIDDIHYDKILEYDIPVPLIETPPIQTKEDLIKILENTITQNPEQVFNDEHYENNQSKINDFKKIDAQIINIKEDIFNLGFGENQIKNVSDTLRRSGWRIIENNSSNDRKRQLNVNENELFIEKCNNSRNALHQHIDYLHQNYTINKSEANQLHNYVDRHIPQEHIIRASLEVEGRDGHDIDIGKSTNVAQGKATISYFMRFEPIPPKKSIIEKFDNRKPMTKEEAQSLTPNNIHYLIKRLEQFTVCSDTYDDNGRHSFRPVKFGDGDASSFFGNDPYITSEIEKYGLTTRFWTGGKYKDINDFFKQHYNNFKNKTIGAIIDNDYYESSTGVNGKFRKTKRAVVNQLLKMTRTKCKKGYVSYRGQGSFSHSNTEVGETFNYGRGDDVGGAGFRSTAITESGTNGFSGLDESTGEVSDALITMLNPAGSEGYYCNGKSKYSWEMEVLVGPEANYQILAYDPESKTMLVYRLEAGEGDF